MVSWRNIETCKGKTILSRELKKTGIIECYWKRGEDMISNVFTKKSSRTKFEKHIKVIVGEDGTPERRFPEEENRSSKCRNSNS